MVGHDLMQETRTICPLCAAPSRFFMRKNEFDIYACTACKLAFVNPMPESVGLYTQDYFAGAARGFGYVDYDSDKAPMAAAYRTYLRSIGALVPKRATLLDVGAATGFFISLAMQFGFEARGVEISAYAAQRARQRGLAVTTGTLADLPLSEPFDAITMLDVLEHVPDPRREVLRARELLQNHGVLAISTLDAGSLHARLMGRRWHHILPPEHLYYFNRVALRALLEEAGFEVLSVSTVGKRFTLSYVFKTLHVWQRIALWGRLSQLCSKGPLSRLSVPINLRDNMFVIARKR
jgi:SAM-dependent methyltransferase